MELTTTALMTEIRFIADRLGIGPMGLMLDPTQPGVVVNRINLPSYWRIYIREVRTTNELEKLVRARQLDALYSLQNDLNKQIIKLGGTIDGSR